MRPWPPGRPPPSPPFPNQAGAALLFLMLALLLAGTSLFLGQANARLSPYQRDQATAAALAQAKEALLGHAAGAPIDISGTLVNAARPGDLPCPDMDNDGLAESAAGCGNGAGTTGQALRLGRLPWKDLGLPDLRDGSGERLWYAVSSNFKKKSRYNAALNSDTPGTITLREAGGRVAFDGSVAAGSGLVAVIIAPGPPLTRPSSLADSTPYRQDRASAPLLPLNYLDLGNGEDNAGFVDGSATDGFIAGPVRDAAGNVVVNDRLAWIRMDELAPRLERRVVAEVAQCLRAYGQASGGRYPWAAAASLGTSLTVDYADTPNRRFGRLPNIPFTATQASATGMSDHWTGDCSIASSFGWWPNWKELVFYAVADRHKPSSTAPVSQCGISGFAGASCLTLDGRADRQFIVLAAGRRLAATAQARGNNTQKNLPANYLEGANGSDDDIFASPLPGTSGNDVVKARP